MHSKRGNTALMYLLIGFSGVSARVMKVAPACAIMISTYEASKSFFRKYNMENLISR